MVVFNRVIVSRYSRLVALYYCLLISSTQAKKCQLFRSNPGLRKVAKNYVKAKFFDDNQMIDMVPSANLVNKDRTEIYQHLIKIIPPSPIADVQDEIEAIHSQFKGKAVVEEHEFSSLILSNSLWLRAGETVVKELIYLDSLQHSYFGNPIISDTSLEALKVIILYSITFIFHSNCFLTKEYLTTSLICPDVITT